MAIWQWVWMLGSISRPGPDADQRAALRDDSGAAGMAEQSDAGDEGRTGGANARARFALRDLLLGVQIAICTLLVTASLVAVRGMVRMLHAPLGFQPQGVMLADMDLSLGKQRGDVPSRKRKR